MEIVIVAQGLPFGPHTIEHRSLGGSETAALMMAIELRKREHLVTIFCNLPPAGLPDHIENGAQDTDGVRWVNFEQYAPFITNTEIDLLIVSRNPDLLQLNHQAKKAVLWCHDLASYTGFLPRLMQTAWNFDEVWTVSEYHTKQIHDVTGYPLKNIRTTRNGIVKFDSILEVPREEKTLLYSARPERGLEYLVKPDGIMSKLPEYKLRVTMYENYPEHMMEYYNQLWAWCHELPNVELLGPKTQLELRQLMRSSWLYVYPTDFEEVSCIIARECIEQKLPFLTTKVGALPETLGSCGWYMDNKTGDEGFTDQFAEAVEYLYACPAVIEGLQGLCEQRTDLYWHDVAEQWEGWAKNIEPTAYSKIVSMIKDSDIIPAMEYMKTIKVKTKGIIHLEDQLHNHYPFLTGETTFSDHYREIYKFEESKGVPERQEMLTLKGNQRYEEIKKQILVYKPKNVLEYGCAEGPIILGLAREFPEITFFGVDFVEDNITLCQKYAKQHDIQNVEFRENSSDNWEMISYPEDIWDMVIVAEVLEHVSEPWTLTDFLESKVKLGGRLVLTVPQGAWEWNGIKNSKQWPWRAHIWHVNKWMLRTMFGDKKNCNLSNLTHGMDRDGRAYGHLVMSYDVDRVPAKVIDPIEKVNENRSRQSIAACMIAMNDEQTILRTLNSIERDIDQLQIAFGPCDDHTKDYVQSWADDHPWIEVRFIDVPRIEAKVFGFDDARNKSLEGIEADWVLWIDSDEYLSGDGTQMFLKNNCFDSYAIHQHHFTCDPRGAPAQLDKPARLIRNHHGFQFFGKVHEHAELGFNGGPGFVMILPLIDIGHTGYVNDSVRRDRFGRNFPLLQWDQEVYPDRKLGRYLWLRDMIHRVRMIDSMGQKQEARRLAEEAIDFFKSHVLDFGGVGSGNVAGNNALAYYSEALKYLGRGFPMAIQVQFEDNTAAYSGVFESAEDAFDLGTKAVNDEMRKRNSGYWG